MHVELGEREVDAGLREFGVDAFVEVEPGAPVVRRHHPGADEEDHRAVVQLLDGDDGILGAGRGPVQEAGVLPDDFRELLLAGGCVRAIGHVHRDVDAPRRKTAVIDDVAVEQGAVRQDDLAVVEGKQMGAYDGHVRDRTCVSLRFDVVAGLERLERHNHQSAGEVLQRAAEGHTDGHSTCSEQGGDGGGVDPERAHDHHDEQDGEQDGDKAGDEGGQRLFRLPSLEDVLEALLDAPDDPGSDDVDEQGQQKLETELHGLLADLLQGGAGVGGEHLGKTLPGQPGRIRPAGQLLLGQG